MTRACVKCPTCGRELEWVTTPTRPFCSERCLLIDLGAWLSEERSIPGQSLPEGETQVTDDHEHNENN